jgi:hypothetical protein
VAQVTYMSCMCVSVCVCALYIARGLQKCAQETGGGDICHLCGSLSRIIATCIGNTRVQRGSV